MEEGECRKGGRTGEEELGEEDKSGQVMCDIRIELRCILQGGWSIEAYTTNHKWDQKAALFGYRKHLDLGHNYFSGYYSAG